MLELYLSMLNTENEKKQFSEIYEKYRHKMFYAANKILNNKEDAKDAVQESFMIIAKNFNSICSDDQKENFVYSKIIIITRNISINIYNKNKKEYEKIEELKGDINIGFEFFKKYEFYELVQAIKELPEIYRDIAYMFYYAEMNAKEISKYIGLSETLVWKRAERAKYMLRKMLEG